MEAGAVFRSFMMDSGATSITLMPESFRLFVISWAILVELQLMMSLLLVEMMLVM
jgi:hypothetical protein